MLTKRSYLSIMPIMLVIFFVLCFIQTTSSAAGLNGTWNNVKFIGNGYNYYTDQVDNIFKTENITIQLDTNTHEVTITVTRNGVTDSDGAFVGFGGNSTFGAKRLGSNWIDLIIGSIDRNNILSGTLIISDHYFGQNAGARAYNFSSDPSFGSEIKGDVTDDNKIGLEEAIHALQIVSGVRSTNQAESIINNFVGLWSGTLTAQISGEPSETIQIQLSLSVNGNTLNGVWTEVGYSTLNITATVTNGTLTFALPTHTPLNPDCANWDVMVTATLDNSLTSMNLNGSGTFCSAEGGGKSGTFLGVLLKQ